MAARPPIIQENQPWLVLNERYQTFQFFAEKLGPEVGMEMMLIPGGRFLMGSPEDELERLDREGPQHQVTVPTFFMGKYPVTQAQWKAVAAMKQVERELKLDPSKFKGDQRPVERVSWYEAAEFCARLCQQTGRDYRLPSEAEWEYACRAGTTTPFHFGETITTEVANYCGVDEKIGDTFYKGPYGRGPLGENRRKTTPVDQFGIANAFGLCDMHGNVWEWCLDDWHETYQDAPTDGSAWLFSGESKLKVLRGGSWIGDPRNCRSAYRFRGDPDFRLNYIGFRVVCVAPRTQ